MNKFVYTVAILCSFLLGKAGPAQELPKSGGVGVPHGVTAPNDEVSPRPLTIESGDCASCTARVNGQKVNHGDLATGWTTIEVPRGLASYSITLNMLSGYCYQSEDCIPLEGCLLQFGKLIIELPPGIVEGIIIDGQYIPAEGDDEGWGVVLLDGVGIYNHYPIACGSELELKVEWVLPGGHIVPGLPIILSCGKCDGPVLPYVPPHPGW